MPDRVTTRAIGQIGDNLPRLMKWAHAHERKGAEITVAPLGRGRFQVTVSIPQASPFTIKRRKEADNGSI